MQDIKNIRREYRLMELDERAMEKDPYKQFSNWMEDALASNLLYPTAMALSTVSQDGKPSCRMVLLKGSSENGFDFFTNYESRKGQHLKTNSQVSLLFFWAELERQIRIEGIVRKLPSEESDAYFEVRPAESQIAAWASPQSKRIMNRKTLMDWYEEFESILKGKPQKRPPHWGGYRVYPDLYEFWQGRESRLHDRIEYRMDKNGWSSYRLAP